MCVYAGACAAVRVNLSVHKFVYVYAGVPVCARACACSSQIFKWKTEWATSCQLCMHGL